MKDYQILVSTTHERMEKGYTETMNLKYQEEHTMKSVNCLMDLIPYQIFKIILSTSSRSMKQSLMNHQFKCMSIKFRTELHSKLKILE